LTEHKYHASYEQIGKALLKYSGNPGLDVVNFCEIVLFSFLTGNADMHLKNFSVIYNPVTGPVLSPAYDMLCTALVNPADDEDLALTLNGKKKRINRKDFKTAFSALKLDAKQQENLFAKMGKARNKWIEFIQISFLSEDFKDKYIQLINERFERIAK
jgi:serine/threonine-protein kinase HipA